MLFRSDNNWLGNSGRAILNLGLHYHHLGKFSVLFFHSKIIWRDVCLHMYNMLILNRYFIKTWVEASYLKILFSNSLTLLLSEMQNNSHAHLTWYLYLNHPAAMRLFKILVCQLVFSHYKSFRWLFYLCQHMNSGLSSFFSQTLAVDCARHATSSSF